MAEATTTGWGTTEHEARRLDFRTRNIPLPVSYPKLKDSNRSVRHPRRVNNSVGWPVTDGLSPSCAKDSKPWVVDNVSMPVARPRAMRLHFVGQLGLALGEVLV